MCLVAVEPDNSSIAERIDYSYFKDGLNDNLHDINSSLV